MTRYIGTKDEQVFLTSAESEDEAYLNIGELMNGFRAADPGNVDLDYLGILPPDDGKTVEINPA